MKKSLNSLTWRLMHFMYLFSVGMTYMVFYGYYSPEIITQMGSNAQLAFVILGLYAPIYFIFKKGEKL